MSVSWELVDVCLSVLVSVSYFLIATIQFIVAARNKYLPFRLMYFVFGTFLSLAALRRATSLIFVYWPWLAMLDFGTTTASCLAAYMLWQQMSHLLEVGTPEKREEAIETLKVVVDSVHDYAIFLLDANGLVHSWNENATKLNGYPAEEIIGLHFSVFYPPEERQALLPEKELETALTTGRFEDQGWRIRKNGSRFWANVLITTLWDHTGKLIGFANLVRDLTEKRRVEDEVRSLNNALQMRVEALEAFNNSVCHDLYAPLRSMEGFAQALQEDYGQVLDDKCRDYVNRICRAAARMRILMHDLVKLGRIARDAKPIIEAFSLSDLAREVVEIEKAYLENQKHKVVIQPAMMACGDIDLTRLLLHNLIANAFKFSSKSTQPMVVVGLQNGEFFVYDNGIGFEQEKASSLFRPFSRLHTSADYPGTGIGLTICKRVVDIHAGTIRGEGKPGEGAIFLFTLANRNQCYGSN